MHAWKICEMHTIFWLGPLGKPSSRCEGNIRMGLRDRGWQGADWMQLSQNRDQRQALLNTIMNLRVSQKAVILGYVSDY
jgi:hypothetical protein